MGSLYTAPYQVIFFIKYQFMKDFSEQKRAVNKDTFAREAIVLLKD